MKRDVSESAPKLVAGDMRSIKIEGISKKDDFERLRSSGTSLHGQSFSLRIYSTHFGGESTGHDIAKVAFVLPKRDFPKACGRNLLKRRFKGAYHALAQQGMLMPGLYLTVGRRSLVSVSYNDMLNELSKLLDKHSRSLSERA